MKKVVCDRAFARLDRFLAETLCDVSRKRIHRACQAGLVLVNGHKRPGGFSLKSGDRVEVIEELGEVQARAELAEEQGGALRHIKIIFEDEHLLVVNKPRAIHSITLKADDALTLSDCIAAHCQDCIDASPDKREAGLVQRLDYFTSGIVLAAKSRAVWTKLHRALLCGKLEKSYIVLVEGEVGKETFEASHPLIQSADSKSMEVDRGQRPGQKSFAARTLFEPIANSQAKFSFVRAHCARARRHQIRVHLSSCGHPLVGDALYGSTMTLHEVPDDVVPFGEGFYLHAETIAFIHPVSGERKRVEG